jgi:hypothetical protein
MSQLLEDASLREATSPPPPAPACPSAPEPEDPKPPAPFDDGWEDYVSSITGDEKDRGDFGNKLSDWNPDPKSDDYS